VAAAGVELWPVKARPIWGHVRRLIQLGAVLTLVLSGVMLVGSFTAADATATQRSKPGVLQAGWFWETAYQQANPPVAAGPLPATEPSGVPDGDFAVAVAVAGTW